MEFKRPENFEDILKLQKHLDESIHSARPRTLGDIKKSMIAECIEFDEETPQSHKTWKTKPYNKAKELEELTDIYFFYAQYINFYAPTLEQEQFEELNDVFMNIEKQQGFKVYTNLVSILDVIAEHFNFCPLSNMLEKLLYLTYKYGYTKDDILNSYWEKWQKNMQRIGKEWN